MSVRTLSPSKVKPRSGAVKPISHRQSILHAEEAFDYFRRVRSRLYKNPLYRGRFVAIRDRQIVDVGDDKFVFYECLVRRFPDRRFVVSQVLNEIPTIDVRVWRSMKHAYSDQFSNPPALIMSAELQFHGRGEAFVKCFAKIDTGADLTAVPRRLIERFKPLAFNTFRVRQTGRREQSYLLEVVLEGRRYSVEAIGHDRPYVLVGRDILNQLTLIADGPGERFELVFLGR